jgi:tetratricopeptide (TPR) repeat protein
MSKKLKLLDIDDARHLNAAVGWLGLGDLVSANEELDEITPEARAHPAVLNMRYQIYAKAKKWDMAAEVALGLTRMLPDDPAVWVYYAYAVRRKTGTGIMQAKEILLEVEPKFPREHVIPFNICCYYSQLHQFEDAQRWLKKEMAITPDKVKRMAIEDEDLKPLWDSMGGTLWKRE